MKEMSGAFLWWLKDAEARKEFPESVTDRIETPCYLISESMLENNLKILDSVQKRTGAKILHSLKAYAVHSTFPRILKYLHGLNAASLNEARLAFEKGGKEVHTFAPAYLEREMPEIIRYSDHIVFNSLAQWRKYKPLIEKSGKKIEVGLRVNPGYAEVETPMYNPCIPGSRLGILPEALEGEDLEGITGLHFHALCEQNSDVLVRVLASFEKRFGKYLGKMKWVNFGGGHHITRKDYNIELLVKTINDFRKKYGIKEIYLEPGEATVLNAGVLVASVLDIVDNGMKIAILDTSAEAHMPDTIIMPYRPGIVGAGEAGKKKYAYRLGGFTCLAGDVIGDYSFDKPLKAGDKLVFLDMALYSIVKNTTFNGVTLPSIALYDSESGKVRVVRKFGYEDYKNRQS